MTAWTFHRLAEDELREAAQHYEEQSAGLGARFLDVVEESLQFLRAFPRAAPRLRGPIRGLTLPRFPYLLI